MTLPIANAPCSWGVDDPNNPHLPLYATVLQEASAAGYRSIELGPWGYLPTQSEALCAALEQHTCRWWPARFLTIWSARRTLSACWP